MNRNKYLLIFCLIVIIAVASIKDVNERFYRVALEQPQISKFLGDKIEDNIEIDPKILIDDHNNIIEKPKIKPSVPRPYITAESYLVANLVTGEKYIDFNSDKVFPIASVSKLYTALVVHHLFDLQKDIEINQNALDAYGDAGHLVLGEKFKPDELLHVLLLESSNDAAVAFADSFGYKDFMEQMNAFAQEIGMHNTKFKDSSGLSPDNVSNASDLLTLTKYLYASEKGILDISKRYQIDIATTTDHGYHHLININPFSMREDFIGGKTGRTQQAKEAMVSLFNQEINGTVYPIAIIVLRSDYGEREINTEKLLGQFNEKILKK